MTNYFKIGDKIVITFEGKYTEGVEYVSQLLDIVSDDVVTAAVPYYKGRLTRLPENLPYTFVFHTKAGRMMYIGQIVLYFTHDKEYLMNIQFLAKGKKMERRDFYRFECLIPIKFTIVQEEPVKTGKTSVETDESIVYDAVVKDISGGGVRIHTDTDITLNEKVRLIIELDKEHDTLPVIAIGAVLGKAELTAGVYKFEYKVVFSAIVNADKERIVRYIFSEQRKQLNILRE